MRAFSCLYLSCLLTASLVGAAGFAQTDGATRTRAQLLAPSETRPRSLTRMTSAERDQVVRLQIFLDEAGFAPGKLDGVPGEFMDKAVIRYLRGHPGEGAVSASDLSLPSERGTYTAHHVVKQDFEHVGALSSEPEAQSKAKVLPYGSVLEYLTERYHCSPELLSSLNPTMALERIKLGDIVVVPAVQPFLIEEVPPQGNYPEIRGHLGRSILVSVKERVLEVSEGDRLIASFPVTTGSSSTPTPVGKWKIQGRSSRPVFRWDEGVLNHGVRTETFFMLPPGPNNPVGVVWIGLNRSGIGIHGTSSPQTIGRSASHGCIRLANWDAVRLVEMVTEGVSVTIE